MRSDFPKVKPSKSYGHWKSLEACRQEWKKYSSIGDFRKSCRGAHKAVVSNGWVDLMRKDFPDAPAKRIKWTREMCREKWESCTSISEFENRYPSAYQAVTRIKRHLRKEWVDEMRAHFPTTTKPRNYWDDIENCRVAWLGCDSIAEFQRNHVSAYNSVRRNGWLGEMRRDFPGAFKPAGYWNLHRCRSLWKTCKSIKEFRTKYPAAYSSVVRKKAILEALQKELPAAINPNNYWTLIRCKEEWKKFPTITAYARGSKASYAAVIANNWVGEMRLFFPQIKTPNWALDECRKLWLNCTTVHEFRDKHWGAYQAVCSQGWRSEMRKELPYAEKASDNDAAYIWKTGLSIAGKDVYKVGITSIRCGDKRIREVAKSHRTTATTLRLVRCCDAIAVENAILDVVTSVKGLSGDGVTEMFTVDEDENINDILELFDRLIQQQFEI